MNIQLGNLGLKDIVKSDYLEKIQDFLDNNGYKKTNRTADIELNDGNYHIFDIPRLMIICDEKKMQEFIKFLQDNDLVGNAFIGSVGLSYYDKK